MRQFNVLRGTKGWAFLYAQAVRWRHMRNQQEVRRRAKALDVWRDHGIGAAMAAFEVSRPTLFRWKQALGGSRGKLDALDPKSRAPKKRRQRRYPDGLLEKIVELRREHPRLGKKKLAALLSVSESYAGRCLTDLKKRNLLPSGRKLSYCARSGMYREQPVYKRKKLRRKATRGMELDTVIRFVDGVKRYILTAIDVERKFAFAAAYAGHSSATAADFLKTLAYLCPFALEELQTDNGSEFAKRFETACEELRIAHFHTYPRSPKMNACVERFNRTLSEDFIVLNRSLLRDDLAAFNLKLADWLLWYNSERPHQSLGMLSPLRYIVSTLPERESHMYWTSTST